LKLKVPLPNFAASQKDDEDDVKFLARVELDAKLIVGSYTRPKHDACIVGLHNGGRLNRVLELTGVAYGPHSVPGSDALNEASKKRKADFDGKVLAKRLKVPKKKKVKTARASALWGKIGLKRPCDTEVSSAKSVKLSKKAVLRAIATAVAVRYTRGVQPVERGDQETSCSHDWSYGSGIFGRVSRVITA
jgi:hypothetical protein